MAAIVKRFQTSTTSCFALEIGDDETSSTGNRYIRFFTNGQQVATSAGPVEVTSPYAAADLNELQFAQINDVLYITHPDYPVYKLTRITDTSWTFAAVEFAVPPMLDENITATTVQLSNYTGTGVSLAATSVIMSDVHVGSYWRIGYKRDYGFVDVAIVASTPVDSNGYFVKGTIKVESFGDWIGTIQLQRKNLAGVWEVERQWYHGAASDANIDHEHEATEAAEYRLSVNPGSPATNARVQMQWPDSIIYGTVKIVSVGSPTSSGITAVVDVVEDLYTQPDWTFESVQTPYWAEGAWSDARGYPRAITLHESRVVYGGTTHQPSTIWGSAVEDFENFDRQSVNDDDSYVFTLAGLELNAIQWLASLGALLCGTTGSEWRIVGDDYGAIISPTKVSAKQFSYHGSEFVQAEMLGNSVVFVERKGRRLREIAWDGQGYGTTDLMLLSEHLTDDGYIRQLAWQKDDRILWVITSDGRLIAVTYNKEQAVLGAHRHVTEGSFRSVATIYGDTGAKDEVWCIVQRTVGSFTVYYVEQMEPAEWTSIEDAFYVDSGLTYDGSPVNAVAGMDHLRGLAVDVLADGVVYRDITVAVDGTVTLPGSATASVWQVGLAYDSELSPFRLDADTQLGAHLGKTKKIDSLKVRVRRSRDFTYDFGGSEFPIKDAEGTVANAVLGPTRAVDIPIPLHSTNTTDPELTIHQSDPVPLTVLALNVGYSVGSG